MAEKKAAAKAAPKPKPITIVGVKVDRFLRLRVARVKVGPEGGLVRITGPNRAGKTSLIRSIRAALGGGKEVPEEPLHDDSKSGAVVLELSNGFTVERKFSDTGSGRKGYLKVIGPDGEEMKQTELNDWLGPRSFDPLHFFSLDAKDQREVLLGLDPELRDNLEELDEKVRRLRTERTPVNSQIQKIQRISTPDGKRPEEVDVDAVAEKLQVATEEQSKRDIVANEVDRHEVRVGALTDGIKDLKERMAELGEELETTRKGITDGLEEIEKLPDKSDEIADLRSKLSTAKTDREAMRPWEEYDRAQEEIDGLKEEGENLTEAIDQTETERIDLLAKLKIPMKGLTFGEDGDPLLNGFPLEQASGREKVELSVAVAMAYDPKLRICLVDEANDLDADGMKALDRKAKTHGFQIWACRLDEGSPGEIVVEDGEAYSEPEK